MQKKKGGHFALCSILHREARIHLANIIGFQCLPGEITYPIFTDFQCLAPVRYIYCASAYQVIAITGCRQKSRVGEKRRRIKHQYAGAVNTVKYSDSPWHPIRIPGFSLDDSRIHAGCPTPKIGMRWPQLLLKTLQKFGMSLGHQIAEYAFNLKLQGRFHRFRSSELWNEACMPPAYVHGVALTIIIHRIVYLPER